MIRRKTSFSYFMFIIVIFLSSIPCNVLSVLSKVFPVKLLVAQLDNNSSFYKKCEDPATASCPEPDKYSPHHKIRFFQHILISFSDHGYVFRVIPFKFPN